MQLLFNAITLNWGLKTQNSPCPNCITRSCPTCCQPWCMFMVCTYLKFFISVPSSTQHNSSSAKLKMKWHCGNGPNENTRNQFCLPLQLSACVCVSDVCVRVCSKLGAIFNVLAAEVKVSSRQSREGQRRLTWVKHWVIVLQLENTNSEAHKTDRLPLIKALHLLSQTAEAGG